MDKYQMVTRLGAGTFGAVYDVKDAAGSQFAMKVLKLDHSISDADAEIANHKALFHPHIIRYHDSFRTDDSLCIVMELANSGNLFELVRSHKRLSENQARWFFQQLILAVDYCHKCGVANRDIKLENLLLHKEQGSLPNLLKMCDFGYSKAFCRSVCKTLCGTPSYMAPEVLTSQGKRQYDGKRVDIWSCGVVLFVMLYGVYPFDGWSEDVGVNEAEKIKRMLNRMQKEKYRLYPEVKVSPDCIDLLRGLLKPQPESRVTMDNILEHPWFQKNLPPLAMDMQKWYLQHSARGDAAHRKAMAGST